MTDGERRYGNVLFERGEDVIRNGAKGRPKTTLKEGVKVRVKNKGSGAHKTGPSLPKYQAPQPEHPLTRQNIENKEIHANHSEHLIVLCGGVYPGIKEEPIHTLKKSCRYKGD